MPSILEELDETNATLLTLIVACRAGSCSLGEAYACDDCRAIYRTRAIVERKRWEFFPGAVIRELVAVAPSR